METVLRQSPAQLGSMVHVPAIETQLRDGWRVVLEYAGEREGRNDSLVVIDLSHLPRYDIQDIDLSRHTPGGLEIPGRYGQAVLSENLAVVRMSRAQAALWHLGPDAPDRSGAEGTGDFAWTDIRENTLCLAVAGRNAVALSEKLTRLDLGDPAKTPPCLVQGPLAGIACQILLLPGRANEGASPEKGGFVFTCARGYARDMLGRLFAAGASFGLRPAGEKRAGALFGGR